MNQHSTPKAPPRVALYARYSIDKQRDESIEDQFRQAERYARQRGWSVVARYSDEAISGSVSERRPGYIDLRNALGSGAFDIVLAESTDRISRDPEHMAHFYKMATFNRVDIYTTGRGKVDVLSLGLSSTIAAIYLEDVAVRTRRGLEGRVEKGRSGGGRSYGYRQGKDALGLPETGLLEIDEIQAGIIRRIFRDYAGGDSPLKIAAALNAEGIPSPSVGTERKSSGHWKQNTINGNASRGTGILNNELYIGRLVWNRLTYSKNRHTERRVSRLNPRDLWQIVDVPHLRIVEGDLWQAVKDRQAAQERRTVRLTSTDRNHLSTGQTLRRRRYLLSGLLRCGICGGSMTVAGSGKYRSYYCANAKEKGPSVCSGMKGLHEAKASELVLPALRSELMQPEAYARFREEFRLHLVGSQSASEDALRLHDAQVAELETKHRNLVLAVENGDFAPAIIARLNAVDAELKEKRAARRNLVPPVVELPEDLPVLYRAMMDDLVSALSAEGIASRASDALHELIERVVVHWDEEAQAHRLEIEGDLLEIMRKSAPAELDAVRDGVIFAEVGCGDRI